MKKLYESPEIEIVSFRLQDVLSVSKDENTASSGYIEEPDDDMIDDGL